MKKFLLALMLFGITFLAKAQNQEKGDLQIGAQGGITVPVSTYKTIADTKMGYHAGMFLDKYFSGNTFGLGIDARYIYNSINTSDSLHFQNGFIATNYSKSRFKDYLFTIGPTYKFTKNKFHLEAYLKGGVMMQYFPEYRTTVEYRSTSGIANQVLTYTNNDSTGRANSWAGVGGLRFNYSLSNHLAIFAHVDYVQTFGSKFGNKASKFQIEELVPDESNPIEANTFVNSIFDHYNDVKETRSTLHKTVNAGVGIKYVFSRPKSKVIAKSESKVNYDNIKKSVKDLQIIVKDKQTNLALSGVTVSIVGQDINEKSITNANGEANKINAIQPGTYQVVGEKNGIKTPLLTLTEQDFNNKSTTLFKEIYHDDPRFTLVGETYDCSLEQFLSGINTILTNSKNKVNLSQISDAEGKFIYQLDPQSDFTVMANQEGRYSQTELVTTKGLDRSQTLYVTLKLGICELAKDGTWVLKNILYDFDKSNIRADAALILDNVVNVMKNNPSLRIELSSHTDSRGDDNYNMKLSQRRAESAVVYLVSKGIASNRMIAKGYGESRLMNNCGNGVDCAEELHQENRRTEIKILDYK